MFKDPRIQRIEAVVARSQELFRQLLDRRLPGVPLNLSQYVRFLSFQYHLTRGVQRYFMTIAAHGDLARRRPMRKFLVDFANEEELHYLVAANDLAKLDRVPLPISFDVELWHAYFRSIVAERPFVRLGAACVLENISAGVARPSVKRALSGPYITRDNSKFLVLHQHDALPHGDQVLEAIDNAKLEDRHYDDLVEGAEKGMIMYLRMSDWAMSANEEDDHAATDAASIEAAELHRIRSFQMAELED